MAGSFFFVNTFNNDLFIYTYRQVYITLISCHIFKVTTLINKKQSFHIMRLSLKITKSGSHWFNINTNSACKIVISNFIITAHN